MPADPTPPPVPATWRCSECGKPATTADGIVGAHLCDSNECLTAAYDRVWSRGTADPTLPSAPASVPEPRDQLRAVAEDLIDTLLKLAMWGMHDSRRDDLRAYAKTAREAIAAAADPYAAGVAAGRTAAAEKVRAMSERMQFMTDAAAALVADRDAAYGRGRTAAAAEIATEIGGLTGRLVCAWTRGEAVAIARSYAEGTETDLAGPHIEAVNPRDLIDPGAFREVHATLEED